jgi:hypothetical protein
MALFDIEDLQDTEILTASQDDEVIPSEYEIDFKTGLLTGRVVEGAEAVAVWAWLCIQTIRYEYMLYSHDYGCEISDLIGQRYSPDYTNALARFMIEDALQVNEYIEGVEDFECTEERGQLHIRFTLLTEFGETEVETDV